MMNLIVNTALFRPISAMGGHLQHGGNITRLLLSNTLSRFLSATAALSLLLVAHADSDKLFDMNLDDLMSMPVSTASRIEEPLRDAPATVIVLTQHDLVTRGYRELSEIYNDLPEMQLSRSYGDTYFKNQWRGLRKTIGVPYLLLLDGVLMNHLWFNQDEIIAAMPITMIERVEIVYGPASVLYGANAFVGVISIVTRQDPGASDHAETVRVERGSFESEIVDMHLLERVGDTRFSLAARYDYGDLDKSVNGRYEYLKDHYFEDRRLWGPFNDLKHFGQYSSPHRNSALDLRMYHQDLEVALQYFTLNTGFGNVYPGDRIQSESYWSEPELSAYMRYKMQFSKDLNATTLLRYRSSGVGPNSDTMEAYPQGEDEGTDNLTRRADYSYWQSDSQSVALYEDLAWQIDSNLTLASGLRVERQNVQRKYNILGGPQFVIDPACYPVDGSTPPDNCFVSLDQYPLPEFPTGDLKPDNHVYILNRSVYSLARYRISRDNWGDNELYAHIGGRYDLNSEVGSAPTKRAGLVYRFRNLSIKALYGESFNEPAGRELYGGWHGSGSSIDLKPETAKTSEFSAGYQGHTWQTLIDYYHLRSDNNIITFSGGATNLGTRDVSGFDLHAQWQPEFADSRLKLWTYYSRLMHTRESIPVVNPDNPSQPFFYEQDIGDNSRNNFWLGGTWSVGTHFNMTLRERSVGERKTVATNPLGHIAGYSTWDLNVLWRDLLPHCDIGLSILNLTDKNYMQPGLREANAGSTAGYFDDNGYWHGSAGFYSSELPQESRGFFLSLFWRD